MNEIVHADCFEYLKTQAENKFSACVTDPPYGWNFMGVHWDTGAIVHNSDFWKEVLRTLKPGGHLLAFCGPRTYHRMVCAIEDAGFEIFDCICWVFGSGFPKGQDISKAIDKAKGVERHGRYSPGAGNPLVTAPATEEAKLWDGYNTALKPATELIVVARKPIEGTYVQNVFKHGCGALNIDECRIGYQSEADKTSVTPQGRCTSKEAVVIGAKPDAGHNLERVEFDRPKQSGRWPANFILSHHSDCKLLEGYEGDSAVPIIREVSHSENQCGNTKGEGMVENWDCVEGCPIKVLDEQSGISKSGSLLPHHHCSGKSNIGTFEMRDRTGEVHPTYGDKGGASRFFPTFRTSVADFPDFSIYASDAEGEESWDRFFYCAKVSKKERNLGCEYLEFERDGKIIRGNIHPTLKPIELMRYLVRLVKPPKDGLILDPFFGSGSTGIACDQEGVDWIGIEKDADSVSIARARVRAWAGKKPKQMTLDDLEFSEPKE